MKAKRIIGLAAALLAALASGPAASEYSFITTTDYSSGAGSVIWLEQGYPVDIGAAPVTTPIP